MSRVLAGLFVVAVVVGCGSQEEMAAVAQLSACCTKAMEIRADFPPCCVKGMTEMTGCCTKGMAEATADADRPECCKTALAKLEGMPECCQKSLTGKGVADCCKPMMAKIALE